MIKLDFELKLDDTDKETFESLFGKISTNAFRWSFYVNKNASFQSLPIKELKIKNDAVVEVIDVNGRFDGDLSLNAWQNECNYHLTISLINLHWRYVHECKQLQFDRLVIEAQSEEEYLNMLRQVIVKRFNQFEVKWIDIKNGNRLLIARIERKLEKHQSMNVKQFQLSVTVATIKESPLIAQYLNGLNPTELTYIEIIIKSSDDIFSIVYRKLRDILHRFNHYKILVNLPDSQENFIKANGKEFIVKLAINSLIELPPGDKFEIIELIFDQSVELSSDDQKWLTIWLAQLKNVVTLAVIDYGMDLIRNTVKLILLDLSSKSGEYWAFVLFFCDSKSTERIMEFCCCCCRQLSRCLDQIGKCENKR